jgi:anti-sigma factor RsiW
MTRCELTTSHLTEYAAGELGALERAIVSDHLDECAHCRAELARELRLRELMAGLPAISCPDDVVDAISAAVDGEPAPRRHPSRFRTWTSTVAAATMVAAAVLLALVIPRDAPITTITPTDHASTSWTQEELDQAREDAQWALVLTASIIERTEKQTIIDVMRRLQAEAYAGFRDRDASTSNGGRG